MKRLVIGAILGLGLTVLSPVQAPVAFAGHANWFYHVNSTTWRVCAYVDGAPAALDAAIQRVSASVVDASRNCNNPNVATFAQSYPDGWFGLTQCNGNLNGLACDRMGVYLNTRVAVAAQQRRKSYTHEMGHAAGLGHRSGTGTCMTQGESPPISEYFDTAAGPHNDLTAINSAY